MKADYRAVRHNIGRVGVIYEMKSTEGARVVTVAGMFVIWYKGGQLADPVRSVHGEL